MNMSKLITFIHIKAGGESTSMATIRFPERRLPQGLYRAYFAE
jgi:ribosomal protein S4